LVWTSNYLILMVLWSIGRVIFRVEADFLPVLREGRTARHPSTSGNLDRRGTFAGRRREGRSHRRDAVDREGRGVLSRANNRNVGHSRAPPAVPSGGYAWRGTP